ncbi:MAG: YDG domain-containing protein [Pseudomonadota bacterium]
MKRHGSLNRIYRLVWSQVLNGWVAVSEATRGRGKGTNRSKLVVAALSLSAAIAQAAPDGGQVVSGSGSISQSGSTTTISQSSQNLSLNWKSFNVGSQETVNFLQPSATSLAVNRIFDTNGSQILGHVNANGQVWLINPNGVLFGQGAQVNVGGLVASTLDLNDASLNSNARFFSGNGTGSVVNRGTINAAEGGYVALLGNKVSNQGVITAQLGAVALGAGSAATLTFSGNSLVHMQVDRSTLNNLAENGGLIRADGGQVVMTAGAKDALLASVVNNSGIIEARTVENHNGTIVLLGGMQGGTANVGGTLDASAPNGGNGGFIETSAAHVKIADNAKVTTASAMGLAGTWLIDPVDFTIAATGGDMTGATLAANLGGGNVTIQSTSGATGTAGDVNVNDVVTWKANRLTLNAQNNININANLNGSGTASLALEYGQGAEASSNPGNIITNGAAVNLPASTTNFTTKQGSDGVVKNYTVITSLGAEGSTTATDLQGMNGGLATNYALGSNIDASATSGWNSGAGFKPLGNSSDPFSGTFDGLGHTISNLTINRPTTDNVGLFGYTDWYSVIKNVGLVGGSVSGANFTGGLAGHNRGGAVNNTYTMTNVTGTGSFIGGLVGYDLWGSTISNSFATGSVSSTGDTAYAGGLVGYIHFGTIVDSYATGNVTGAGGSVGGLVGSNSYSTINNSYATGNVTGTYSVGGLIGGDFGTVSNSYSTGNVTGSSYYIGGLVGYRRGGSINNSYATGDVIGTVGVSGAGSYIGGLVGQNDNGTISNSYANGSVSGAGSDIGGLVGANSGTVSNSYWNTTSSGQASSAGGTGLTSVQMEFTSSFTGFNFTTTPGASGNNWVMVDVDGSLNNAGGASGATRPILASEYATKINNTHQLQLMAMAPAANYTLGANINAASTGNSTDVWGSSGFVSVGNSSTPFTGTFDGLGHTVFTLNINAPLNFAGLFGITGTGSIIRNVGLIDGSVSGSNFVGGLVAKSYGTISNSYTTGNVRGTGTYIGGVAGISYGTISDSHATGNVNGGDTVGGLLGRNDGTVSNSYATGNVTGTSWVGGLAGYNHGMISNSYAMGNVSGTNYIGGLVGFNDGWFNGGTIQRGTISDGYSTGNVSGTGNFGGLVGVNNGTVRNSHYNINGVAINNITGADITVGGIYAAQYMDWFSHGLSLNIANYASLSGSGNSYSLSTVQGMKDLLGFTDNPAYAFRLTGNIDLAAAPNLHIPYLAGSFDGAGFIISNLNLNQPLNNTAGLFGQVVLGGAVSNVGLLNATVSGNMIVGALAGRNDGTVSNSYATGTVNSANYYSGGLIGLNYGTVSNSYATVNVSGTGSIGGLIGHNDGALSNSYATGNVNGTGNYVGGLIGMNSSTVSNSYSTGHVSGAGSVGGLAGASWGTISNSYWNTTTSGQASSSGGTGLTSTQMQQQSNFISWDFSGTWIIYNGHTNPLLRSFMKPLTVTANNTTKTYDRLAYSGGNGVTYSNTLNGNLLGTVSYSGTSQGAVNAGSYGITLDGLYSNQQGYIISYTNGTLTVNPASLSVIGTTVSNKIYDGTTAATLTGGVLNGVISGDTVTLTQAGTYATKNVGTNIAVTTNDSLGGASASNYSLAQPTGLTANIKPKALTIDGTTASNKIYDGTTAATLTGGILNGVISGDTVTLTQAGTFATKNVGTNIAVTTNDSLGGASASNYTLTQPTGLAANIKPKALTISGITASNKVYDGTTAATVSTAGATYAGLVAGDMLKVSATGVFTDKNVGTGKTVLLTSTYAGVDVGNYSITGQASTTANITPAPAYGWSDSSRSNRDEWKR